MEKLLELIEEKKLEVTRLTLADVTADFLKYVKTLEAKEGTEAIMADFLVVASRLLLIKSKALLPALPLTEEEEGAIRDLEGRLQLYQELKATQRLIRSKWDELPQMLVREFLSSSEPVFYPPKDITPALLADTVRHMVGELERVFRPAGTIKAEILHLKETIERMFARLTVAPKELGAFRMGKGRTELVVLFLAVLHLIKDQLVEVTQTEHFGAINIAKRT